MGKKVGIFCILLGIACLLSSAGLIIYNRYEAQSGESVNGLVSKAAVSSFCMDSARFACTARRAERGGWFPEVSYRLR
jgi:hypothetical protein